MDNLLLCCDSYKYSHWLQYPEGTDGYFGYIEARSPNGHIDSTVFFGLQYFLKKYLSKPFTKEDIEEAAIFAQIHGVPFNEEGWTYILNTYDGYIPVLIKAVPEGLVIPIHNVLCTVECLDPACYWVGSWLETALLRAIWYPTTVASNSKNCKNIIKHAMEKTSDSTNDLAFKLHDFGA